MNKAKWLGVLFFTFLILFIYVFIPNEINNSYQVIIPQNQTGISRKIVQLNLWSQWMPYKTDQTHQFELPSGKLLLSESYIASVKGLYTYSKDTVSISFTTEKTGKDSTLFSVETFMDNKHLSPIKRIENYWQSKNLAFEIKKMTAAAQNYFGTTKGVYGFDIAFEKVKDSILITTQQNLSDTPNNYQIYQMIDLLKKYIQKNNGAIVGDPMVNITNLGPKNIFLQVGLPIKNTIPEASNFVIKKMVLGNILSTKANGDNEMVYKAFKETENFVHDHSKESPAMPFIVYNTNRMLQKDSSKWQATIYYPIY